MGEGRTVEAVLRCDRAVVLAGLAGLSALTWAYLLTLAWRMPHWDMAMAMPHMQVWGATEVLLTCVMWAVMMVAMMTPSAAPMILTFATLNRLGFTPAISPKTILQRSFQSRSPGL